MAVAVMGDRTTSNEYGTAIKVSLGLSIASAVMGFVMPSIIAWFAYLGLWCFVVMKTYRFGFTKSICVAGLMKILGWVLVFIADKLFGITGGCGVFT